MRIIKSVNLEDGREVLVKEILPGEYRVWLASLEQAEPDVVGDLLDLGDGLVMNDLALMSDLTRADMDSIPPSQLRRVADAAREVNRDFFAWRAKLAGAGLAVLQTPAAS